MARRSKGYLAKTFRNVVPGLNITVSNKGVGASIGAKGARIRLTSGGNVVASVRKNGFVAERKIGSLRGSNRSNRQQQSTEQPTLTREEAMEEIKQMSTFQKILKISSLGAKNKSEMVQVWLGMAVFTGLVKYFIF